MKRRTSIALSLVSLTALSACVTKVVEGPATTTTQVSTTSTSTEAPVKSELSDSPGKMNSAETLRRRQDVSIQEGFIRGLKANKLADETLTDYQAGLLFEIALSTCAFFDRPGTSMLDWFTEMGFFNDQAIDNDEKELSNVSVVAVGAVCPEHVAVVDDFAQALNEVEASQAAP